MFEDLLRFLTDNEKPMTYDEAVKYFAEKLTLTAKEFNKLAEEYRTFAFTVSGYTSLGILKAFQAKLTEAVANGTTEATFRQEINDFLSESGYDPISSWAAENIFRTNLQTAYNVGAYQEMTSEGALKARPYWMYEAVEDERTRPTHLAMNGKVFPADSPIWDMWYPPNGFRCRCGVVSLSQREVDAMGVAVEDIRPDWSRIQEQGVEEFLPDKSFRSNPAKIQFEPELDGFPPALIKAFEERYG